MSLHYAFFYSLHELSSRYPPFIAMNINRLQISLLIMNIYTICMFILNAFLHLLAQALFTILRIFSIFAMNHDGQISLLILNISIYYICIYIDFIYNIYIYNIPIYLPLLYARASKQSKSMKLRQH